MSTMMLVLDFVPIFRKSKTGAEVEEVEISMWRIYGAFSGSM